MKRPMARKRQLDVIKRRRKIQFMKNAWHLSDELLENPKFTGQLTKGKIHCSCPMCAVKTKTDGWKHSDMQKLESISNQLLEEYNEAYEELAKMELRLGLWDY